MYEVMTPQTAAGRESDGLRSLKPCAAPDGMSEGAERYKHMQGWYLLKFTIRKTESEASFS